MDLFDIKCPYCQKGLYINHDDGYGYEENTVYEQICKHCGETFTYTTTIIFNYHVSKSNPELILDSIFNQTKETEEYHLCSDCANQFFNFKGLDLAKGNLFVKQHIYLGKSEGNKNHKCELPGCHNDAEYILTYRCYL